MSARTGCVPRSWSGASAHACAGWRSAPDEQLALLREIRVKLDRMIELMQSPKQ